MAEVFCAHVGVCLCKFLNASWLQLISCDQGVDIHQAVNSVSENIYVPEGMENISTPAPFTPVPAPPTISVIFDLFGSKVTISLAATGCTLGLLILILLSLYMGRLLVS